MTCDIQYERLAEYIAEGEPMGPKHADLRAHMMTCPHCRSRTALLRQVECALRAWPMENVSQPLHTRLMATLRPAPAIDWYQLPWSLWLPVLTLLSAVGLAVALVPPAVPVTVKPLGSEFGLLRSLLAGDGLTAMWVGLATALAGIGVTIALALGRLPNAGEIESARSRASEAVEHVRHLAMHSR
jgi:anti-sigma factor RsiW